MFGHVVNHTIAPDGFNRGRDDLATDLAAGLTATGRPFQRSDPRPCPNTRTPSRSNSSCKSRNAHDWGVHPLAPGIRFHPSGNSSPGRPVLG